jgi:hypothetical protein
MIFKLLTSDTLSPGEVILDKENGVIYCNSLYDFMDFMKEYNEE